MTIISMLLVDPTPQDKLIEVERLREQLAKALAEIVGQYVTVTVQISDIRAPTDDLAAAAIQLGWTLSTSNRGGAWVSSPNDHGGTFVWFADPHPLYKGDTWSTPF